MFLIQSAFQLLSQFGRHNNYWLQHAASKIAMAPACNRKGEKG